MEEDRRNTKEGRKEERRRKRREKKVKKIKFKLITRNEFFM